MGSSSNHQTTFIVLGVAAIATAAAVWYLSSKQDDDGSANKSTKSLPSKDVDSGITPTKSNQTAAARPSKASGASTSATTAASSKSSTDDADKVLHRRIEEIDRAGKALFKEKKFVEAAETFTEALDLIEAKRGGGSKSAKDGESKGSSSLTRQVITLTNNRSAMYEKASFPDLALADCDAVLELDPAHTKARTRRLRILESQQRHMEALVEVCALQLKFMNDNRDKLRLGLPPTGHPPVSQSKVEELVTLLQPGELQRAQEALDAKAVGDRALPSPYTITQLLKSFSGYNKWMGEAAKGGTAAKFTSQIEDLLDHVPRKSLVAFADNVATKATLLLNRGRRYAFEKQFEQAVKDFDDAFALAEDAAGSTEGDHEEVKTQIVAAMEKDDYARLLEWSGMCRHLRYELKGALACYERCSELEPENTELLVKRAGVKMDGTKHSEAEALFAEALTLNPTASDALLHRANLRMLQQRVADSQSDLETCIRLYPNNLLARLRLATVHMAKEDMDGAKRMLDQAEEYDPESSEVHCYRGELHFAKGEFADARKEFDAAMKCDPTNPTPYVNAALAVMNTPPTNGSMVPDFNEATRLLHKAIEVDPMFHAAYVQLGQLKLSMATDLTKAREVVELYDRGLEYCRTPEELKDICSMRILTVAQIDAAHALRMETLNMQNDDDDIGGRKVRKRRQLRAGGILVGGAVAAAHLGEDSEVPPVTSSPSDSGSAPSLDEARDVPPAASLVTEVSLAAEETKEETDSLPNGSVEEKKVDITMPTDADDIPDLSSPTNSAFRQSLDEEARAKDQQRQREAERIETSKALLRESFHSLTARVDAHGESVLTKPERTFLEMLLESDGPGAAEACMAAHKRLMDGNLFWAVCGGAAGEVAESMIPGHNWRTQDSAVSLNSLQQKSQNGDWVEDWVAKGSRSGSQHGSKDEDEKKTDIPAETPTPTIRNNSGVNIEPPAPPPPGGKAHSSSHGSIGEILKPYDLQRRSSEARLNRLEFRRRQSSLGSCSTARLFQAHEAGLTVSAAGSARRNLQRLGLPMEKGMFAPPPMPLGKDEPDVDATPQRKGGQKEEEKDPNATILTGNLRKTLSNREEEKEEKLGLQLPKEAIQGSTFQKVLNKMDERTIRRIEKEERAKQKKEQHLKDELDILSVGAPSTAVFNTGGCISLFSMSILRRMFASKQFSFHRSSSSYTRAESFLGSSSNGRSGSEFLTDSNGDDSGKFLSDSTTDDSDKVDGRDDIFRATPPRRGTTDQDRLKNLLVNAGFRGEADDEEEFGLVVDAEAEDDLDILSVGTGRNSIVALLKEGGPSYRDVDMFRGSDDEDEGKKSTDKLRAADMKKKRQGAEALDGKNEKLPQSLDVKKMTSSLVSSLGSKSSDGLLPESPKVNGAPSDDAKDVSPANSDVGELPDIQKLSQSERGPPRHRKRSTTIGVLKTSSSSTNNDKSSPSRKYKRSVSWNHLVFDKKETQQAMAFARQDSAASLASVASGGALSVISFPNLRRAAPLRSDSMASIASNASSVMPFPPPLRHGVPLRSDSMSSMASFNYPMLSRAHSVHSPRPSFSMTGIPPLMHAHHVWSMSQMSLATADLTVDDDDSLNSADYVENRAGRPNGAAWQNPMMKPPLHNRIKSSSSVAEGEHAVFIRQASRNDFYEGAGIEIEESPVGPESLHDARRFRSMVSLGDSVHSRRSIRSRASRRSQGSFARSSSRKGSMIGTTMYVDTAMDDGFIVKEIDFERHTSEILRSLSNEDLPSSHHLETINGSSKAGSRINEPSSVARVRGDSLEVGASESWDLESNASFAANAWGVLEDEYAEGYGAMNTLPFQILGTSATDMECHPHVLSPPLMESLQNFMPAGISETNFWLKYSLVRDGAFLPSLLKNIRGTKYTLIAIETVEGEVFGSFTSSPWRKNWNYYGGGESFLWRMRRTRSERDAQRSVIDQAKLESELDVFYWTGRNDLVQYCTTDMIALGGGTLRDEKRDDVTDAGEQRDTAPEDEQSEPKVDKGGFGLAIDSDLLRGTSSACATFGSPPLSKAHADGSPFEILNVECWTMTPCMNIADAENLEMKTLFLDAYSREL
ncbi:hypothetical protein ACHAXT_006820 [Thalassiosira profunda]